MSAPIAVHWSVWERSATVKWSSADGEVAIQFDRPPLSVSILPARRQVAIATSPSDDAVNELRFYSYDGELAEVALSAATGFQECLFLHAAEGADGALNAAIWCGEFPSGTDQMGKLDLQTGKLSALHPIR